MKFQLNKFMICLLIPLSVGAAAGLISSPSTEGINMPPLSPPAIVFPLMWILLYTLMGISSYLLLACDASYEDKKHALTLYGTQLAVNFFWPILFFNFRLYFLSFLWILLLWGLVFLTVVRFSRLCRPAGIILTPYPLWVTFAAYLNLATFLLNR